MLPKRHRLELRQAAPFYTFPNKHHSALVSLYWKFSAQDSTLQQKNAAQAAVVVSKKVAPTAVERNFLKRITRALLLPFFPTLPPNLQLVIVIKNPVIAEQRDTFKQLLVEKLLAQKKSDQRQ